MKFRLGPLLLEDDVGCIRGNVCVPPVPWVKSSCVVAFLKLECSELQPKALLRMSFNPLHGGTHKFLQISVCGTDPSMCQYFIFVYVILIYLNVFMSLATG